MSVEESIAIPTEIESERLILRAPRLGDGLAVQQAIHESWDSLKRWMPWANSLPTPEETEKVQAQFALEYQERKSFNLLIFRKDTNGFVGYSGIPRLDWSIPKFEIGYWVSASASGQGFIAEAVSRVTDFSFDALRSRRTEIYCDSRNERSWRVAERAGYVLEAQLQNHRMGRDGVVSDTRVYVRFN